VRVLGDVTRRLDLLLLSGRNQRIDGLVFLRHDDVVCPLV